MDGWNEWDLALLAIAAHVSIVMLVQLMRQRRDGLIDFLAQRASQERRKSQAANQRSIAPKTAPRRDAA